MFPDFGSEPVRNSVDAPLWFIHAVERARRYGANDERVKRELWPAIRNIVSRYMEGTDFGIHMDASDGLLAQGASGFQLTWMIST